MWIYTLFPQILNMSLTASIVIVFVLLARLLLKKAPKIFSYALWAVVLFRLLCPVSISSEWSLLNVFDVPFSEASNIEYIPTDIVHTEHPQVNIPIPGISEAINKNLPQGEEQLVADPLEAPMAVTTCVWLIGMVALLLHSIISLIKLRRKLIGAVHLRDNVYLADHIASPFVMGVLRPKIYLPSTLTEQEQAYIIQHEQRHLRRFDPLIKILAFIALCVHWFNPLVWLAFVLSGKDMEMSCDEAVMKSMDCDIRAEYSVSLLSLATGRKIVGGTPLAFGEGDTKSRIQNVLNYKKPAFWVIVVSVIAIVAVGIGLAANPKPNRHFATTGRQLSDLQPEKMTQQIAEITKVDVAELEMTADNFGLTVSSNFSWVNSEAIRFVFSNQRNVPQAAQLRIFPEESDFFVTEPADWAPSEGQLFKLQRYLEALRYLPQEAIASLCKQMPQRYAIEIAEGDRKRNPERSVYYDRNGVTAEQSWWIRLDIIPLYGDGAGFNGKGSDTISLYYGDVADTVAPNAMRPMVMVDGVLYLDTGKEAAKNVDNSAILGEITSAASASEKPTENGQCNFGSGVGAEYAAYEDGIAVLLDHKWFFFEKEAEDTAPDVQPKSTNYLQSLTAEERKQTEELVRAYFTDEAPYYEGVVSIEPMPNESVLYQNTGMEAEYAPGNIIIYKLLTGRDRRDKTPERSASVARASKDAPWELINQGY